MCSFVAGVGAEVSTGAVCAVSTEATLAVNWALAALAATPTVAGTVTAPPLLAKLTVVPPPPDTAFNLIVQTSVAEPSTLAVLQ